MHRPPRRCRAWTHCRSDRGLDANDWRSVANTIFGQRDCNGADFTEGVFTNKMTSKIAAISPDNQWCDVDVACCQRIYQNWR